MTQSNNNPPWGPPPGQPATAPQHGPTGAPPPWQPQPGQPPPAPQGAPPPWGTQAPPTSAPPGQPAPQWGPPAAPPAGPPPMAPPPGYPSTPQGYGPPPGYPSAGQTYGPPAGYPGAPQYGPSQGYPAPGGYGGPGFLDGIGDAQAYTKTPFFPPGVDCVVQLEELKGVVSQDPSRLGALMIVVECSVVSSQSQGIQPGNRFAQVINLAKYGKGDLKAVLTALHACTPGNPAHEQWLAQQGVYTKEKVSEFIGASQPLRGRKMGLRTVFKPNRNPTLAREGKGFTNHHWSPAQ